MARSKRQPLSTNPLIVGISALIVIMLMTSASFNTPLVSFSAPSGESMPLSFSSLGLPLLGMLLLAIIVVRMRK